MKALFFFLLNLVVAYGDTGKTPVETEAGVVPLENCLLRQELDNDVRTIKEQMRAFGISRSILTSYSNYIRNGAAVSAKASSEVVCIPPHRVREVGTRLGEIIWDFIDDEGPRKRRGERPQFDFDPERDGDDTVAKPGRCCRCEENEFSRLDNGEWRSGCTRGPCCPELCKSLNRLQVAASEGVLECCNRNPRDCLHERDVQEGQRGARDPKFT